LNTSKQTWIVAFALFSLFFGAGNLILPPYLGYRSGADWGWASLGFILSAVLIPLLAILGYARIQKSFLGFSSALGKVPSIIYGLLMYSIAISLPCPRTASVTYEMAIVPYFDISSLSFSIFYFMAVGLFAMNRSKLLDLIGKYLTPLIVLLLLGIIFLGLINENMGPNPKILTDPVAYGFLEGYQTFDAIGGVVVGGVIVISLSLNSALSNQDRRKIITRSGFMAGVALVVIYIGLIALGSKAIGNSIETRTALLYHLSQITLGSFGAKALAVLLGLACFTTAVGIVVGMADFIKELFGNSPLAFRLSVVLGCVIGVLIGQFSVPIIITLAVPALLFIYPITIVLILINALPSPFHKKTYYRVGVSSAVIFSFPEFLYSIAPSQTIEQLRNGLPLGENNLGWLLPTVILLAIYGIMVKISNFNRAKMGI